MVQRMHKEPLSMNIPNTKGKRGILKNSKI